MTQTTKKHLWGTGLTAALLILVGLLAVVPGATAATANAPLGTAVLPSFHAHPSGTPSVGETNNFNCQTTSWCNTTTAAASGSVVAGNFMLATVEEYAPSASLTATVTDTLGDTWTQQAAYSYACGTGTTAEMLFFTATAKATTVGAVVQTANTGAYLMGIGVVVTNGSSFDNSTGASHTDTLSGYHVHNAGSLTVAVALVERLAGATTAFDIAGTSVLATAASFGFSAAAATNCAPGGFAANGNWLAVGHLGPIGSNITYADSNINDVFAMASIAPATPPPLPAGPGAVYLVNSTSTTATATWTAGSGTAITHYTASVYAGTACAGTALSSVTVTLPARLTATLSGLTASTAYSVGVTWTNATVPTSATTCGASENGAGQTTAPYAGWNYWFRNVTATNVTLPTTGAAAVAGNRQFFSTDNGFETPVIANSTPLSAQTEIFYENTTGYLYVENAVTRVASLLPGQTRSWVNASASFVTLNGLPSTLMPFVQPNNEVTALFAVFVYGTGFYGEVYWLANSTEQFVNAPGIVPGTSPVSGGLMPGGWFWFVNDTSTGVQMKNVWSRAVVDSSLVGVSPWSVWNSAVYIPVANQIITDVNNATTHTVTVRAFQFDPVTGAFNATVTLDSPVGTFITGPDTNNMNYYYVPNGTKVNVYGLGSDSGADTTYHLLTITLATNSGSDAVTGLRDTQAIGTTDSAFVALPAPANFSLNGATGAAAGAGAQQAPLIDPLHNVSVWDLGTASPSAWFNGVFTTCIAFCVTSPWASSWSFVRGTWGTTTAPQDAIITPTGTGTAGGTVLTYSAALGTKVVTQPFVGLPPSPTGLVASAIGFTNATLTWVQSAGGGIVNNTVYLYFGTCSGPNTAYSTGGPATTKPLVGLSAGTTYAADVTSWNATGQSAPSSCVTFTTLNVVIPPPPTQSFSWVWLLLVLGAVPVVATFVYRMGRGYGLVGGTRAERQERRRGRRASRPSLSGGRVREAFSRSGADLKDSLSRGTEGLRNATRGARDRFARLRYRAETRGKKR